MHLKYFLFILFFWVAATCPAQKPHYEAYIKKYKWLAIREMQQSGIPASIKLAQALLESDGGRSNLAKNANNHFGIKCGKDWRGRIFVQYDDERDVWGRPVPSCFRAFRSISASYIAHSQFLLNPQKRQRYGFLFFLDPIDYRQWAIGLRDAGYSTDPYYHIRLIELIETYRLYRFDQEGNKRPAFER